jgi:hypothetical protein
MGFAGGGLLIDTHDRLWRVELCVPAEITGRKSLEVLAKECYPSLEIMISGLLGLLWMTCSFAIPRFVGVHEVP